MIGLVLDLDPDRLDVFLPQLGVEMPVHLLLREQPGPHPHVPALLHRGGGTQGLHAQRLWMEPRATAQHARTSEQDDAIPKRATAKHERNNIA
jgi:hypothetical protein